MKASHDFLSNSHQPTWRTSEAPFVTAANYRLRFFFDGVAGDCLWAGNEVTTERFDYPISINALPVPASVVAFGRDLVDRYTAIAADDFHWPDIESMTRFRSDASEFLHMLRENLSNDFVVVDESGMT